MTITEGVGWELPRVNAHIANDLAHDIATDPDFFDEEAKELYERNPDLYRVIDNEAARVAPEDPGLRQLMFQVGLVSVEAVERQMQSNLLELTLSE